MVTSKCFEIMSRTIDLPKGGGRRPLKSLQGDKNSIQTIEINNQLCMVRAIGAGWVELNLPKQKE